MKYLWLAVFHHAPGATVDTVALEGTKTACTKSARAIAREREWRFVELCTADAFNRKGPVELPEINKSGSLSD